MRILPFLSDGATKKSISNQPRQRGLPTIKNRRTWAAAAMSTLLLSAGGVIASAPASAAPYYDGADPIASGCAGSAITLWSANNPRYGYVEVRYSTTCRTEWVRVTKEWGLGGYFAVDAGRGPQVRALGKAERQAWTPMVSTHHLVEAFG